MYSIHLFAGAGGGIIADALLGHTPICAVEIEAYPRRVLLARQLDGILPVFPIWDDVTTFRLDNPETRPFFERAKEVSGELVVCGGFPQPCQDISAAGKGEGITGKRSGLWKEMSRIVGEVRPRYVFVENSPMLTLRGLGVVLGDLAALGYDARWGVVSAENAGAPHKRERIWIVADAAGIGSIEAAERRKQGFAVPVLGGETPGDVADADRQRLQEQQPALTEAQEHAASECGGWWATEPDVGRVVNGLAFRVDRLKALGNGQVPFCAALAWRILQGRDGGER